MSSRKIRRAAEHAARKAARKAGFPNPSSEPTVDAVAAPAKNITSLPDLQIPETGAPLPPFSQTFGPQAGGPVTEIGKAISSQNRVTHGLTRHNGVFKLLTTEDPQQFVALKRSLAEEHGPTTETESLLINTMAESHWLANRAQSLIDTCLDPDTGAITNERSFSLYLRYQTTHSRQFHKAFNDLAKQRAEKSKADKEFVAQNRSTEKHEMQKQLHYWNVVRRDSEACSQMASQTREYLKGVAENPQFVAQYDAALAKHGLKRTHQRVAVAA